MTRLTNQKKLRAFSIVEVMVAAAIMAVAAAGLISAYIGSIRQNQLIAQQQTALNAMRGQVEEIKANVALSFGVYDGVDGVIQRYQSPDDTFNVQGLNNPSGGTVGQIFFYLNESAVPVQLGGGNGSMTQIINDIPVGPKDLDGDGNDTDNHATPVNNVYSCDLVPIEVRVTWQSPFGLQTESQFVLLARTED